MGLPANMASVESFDWVRRWVADTFDKNRFTRNEALCIIPDPFGLP